MAGPEYDFFATGLRAAPAPSSPVMPTSPGGSSIVPGVAGPEVSRFGLPADAAAAPAGPMAAPGYGGDAGAGLTAGWDGAAVPGSRMAARHAAEASAASSPAYDVRPGAVKAAGIIAIVGAVLIGLVSGVALLGVLALKSQLDDAIAASDGALTSDMTGGLVAAVMVTAVMALVIAVLYGLLGWMVVRGRRWAAWTLLVLSALSLAGTLYQGLSNGDLMSFGSLLNLAVPTALVLLLSLGEGGRWLRRS